MIRFEVKSKHSPDVWLKLWDQRVVPYDSKNKSAYSDQMCFFGTKKDNELNVFFHRENESPHIVTRFMGRIEADGSGSRIYGSIGKMKATVIFLWFMVFAMCFGGFAMIVNQSYKQGAVLFGFAVVALLLVLITPKSSVNRLKKLLAQISVDEYDGEAVSEKKPKKK